MVSLPHLPFLLHDLVATAAGLTFIFRPSAQLQPLSAGGELILHCYGGVLLFTSLISLIFYARAFDDTSRLVCLSFAFWHVWPSYRAVVRMQRGIDVQGELGKTLGGPAVHLATHAVLFVMFVASAVS